MPIDKRALIEAIISRIEKMIESASHSAKETAQSATDDESRSEGKYDTRGLETSYVASAQAHYVKDLKQDLSSYMALDPREFKSDHPIALSAIVTTLSQAGRERFFVGPAQGGTELEVEGETLSIVTPKSPLGRELIGSKTGSHVPTGNRTVIRVE